MIKSPLVLVAILFLSFFVSATMILVYSLQKPLEQTNLYPSETKTEGENTSKLAGAGPKLVIREEIKAANALIAKKPTQINQVNKKNLYVTFYGFVDNDPPGKTIAFPHNYYPSALHNIASGTGTYSDPVTLAVKNNQWNVGTRMYVPYLKKYFIVEDICASCSENQIDVWMESDGSHESELLACENKWTKSVAQVELNPPTGRSVNTTPFFDIVTGICNSY